MPDSFEEETVLVCVLGRGDETAQHDSTRGSRAYQSAFHLN